MPRAEAAARRAIELDPNYADGYASLGRVMDVRRQLVLAEELYSKALALDPNNPDVLHRYSSLLAGLGRLKEALAMRQLLQQLEPFVPIFNAVTASVLWENGQNDIAIAMFKDMPQGRVGRAGELARIYAAAGRYSEAVDSILEIPPGNYLPGTVEEAARLLRKAPAIAASPQSLPRLGYLGFVYLYVGAPDRILDFHDGSVAAGYSVPGTTAWLWHPSYAPVRKTERFKAFVQSAGLVDYWRVKGWPEFCRPMADDDFVCV